MDEKTIADATKAIESAPDQPFAASVGAVQPDGSILVTCVHTFTPESQLRDGVPETAEQVVVVDAAAVQKAIQLYVANEAHQFAFEIYQAATVARRAPDVAIEPGDAIAEG